MKNLKLALSLFLFFFSCFTISAQNSLLLINEIGILPKTDTRYIEFVVIGNADMPIGQTVNLEGWSIDNNSAADPNDEGYISFGTAFSALFPGTLILIYDDEKVNENVDPNQDGLPNSAGVYQLPISSPDLQRHQLALSNIPFSWSKSLNFTSAGDAIVIRDANQVLQHAINWAGTGYSDASRTPVINLTPDGLNPTVNTINLESPCTVLGKNFTSGQDHSFRLSTTPGQYNSIPNGLWINDLTASGPGVTSLTMACNENEPATETTLGSIGIEIKGGKADYTLSWNGPQSGSITVPSAGLHLIQNLPVGTYFIQLSDSRGCNEYCQTTIRDLESTDLLCKGACTEIGVTESPGECYLWEPSGDLAAPHPGMWSPCPEETTVYTLTISNEDGDVVEVKAYEVEVQGIEVKLSPDPAILCGSDPIVLDAGTFPNPVTYEWSTDDTTPTISKNILGVYSVTVTEEGSGCTSSDEVEILAPDDCEGIASWFEENGFKSVAVSSYEVSVFRNESSHSRSSSGCYVNDYADIVVTIDGTAYDLEEVMCQNIDVPNFSIEVYITSNSAENMCVQNPTDSYFDQVKENWETTPHALMIWTHVCLNEDGTATLYWNERLKMVEEPEVTDDCEQDLLNAISNEWIRKAFAYGKGKPNNNIKICEWHQAILDGNDSGFYKNAIGRIGEALVAQELSNSFEDHGLFEIATIDIVPGGNNAFRLDPQNKHIDIGAYFFMYRTSWPFSNTDPGVSGIKIPISDKQTGIRGFSDFRILNPNDPLAQIGLLEVVVEVKTYASTGSTLNNVGKGIDQINEGIQSSILPGIGLLVIPKERWIESQGDQNVIDLISNFEDQKITLFSYPEEQQSGYFLLSNGLRGRAEGAYKLIKQTLAAIDCECN